MLCCKCLLPYTRLSCCGNIIKVFHDFKILKELIYELLAYGTTNLDKPLSGNGIRLW